MSQLRYTISASIAPKAGNWETSRMLESSPRVASSRIIRTGSLPPFSISASGLNTILNPPAGASVAGVASTTPAVTLASGTEFAAPATLPFASAAVAPSNIAWNTAANSLARVVSGSSSACRASNRARIQSTDCKNKSTESASKRSSPSRILSSRVSRIWVNSETEVKPKVPLPPFIEWAARKILFISSTSGSCGWISSNAFSITSKPSKLSSKNTAWNWLRSILMDPPL